MCTNKGGGRGSTSGKVAKGGGAISTEEQKPTKAKIIEKMNEAQLDIEIAKQQSIIESANRTMGNIPKSENIGAIPLGQITRGKTQSQKDRIVEKSLNQAVKFTDAYNRRERAERELNALQRAKKEVAGTGKTQREVREAKKNEIAKSSTMQWTGGKGSYRSGEFRIERLDDLFFVYKGQKQIGYESQLKKAKAFADRYNNLKQRKK